MTITGETDLSLAEKALTLGARSYITKPFDFDALLSEVKRLLAPASATPEDGGKPWRIAGQ